MKAENSLPLESAHVPAPVREQPRNAYAVRMAGLTRYLTQKAPAAQAAE